jgi:hypothetical protein
MRSMAGVFFNIDFLHEHLDSPQICGRVYVISGAPEEWAVPAPLVTPVVVI